MLGYHFGYLDGWRGLAIVFLLIGHFFPVPGINLGTFGVNLFFVLSGLLMSQLLFIQKTPINIFYKRRISRIFPAHFIFLGSVLVSYLFIGKIIEWPEATAAAIFFNNYLPGELGHAVMPFGHIWSLSVEEHSYIALSIIATIARRTGGNPLSIIIACCIGSVTLGTWYWTEFSGKELYGKWMHSEVAGYGIFISALFMLYFHRRSVPRLHVLIYPILAFSGLALHWWSVPSPIRTFLGVAMLALLVNLLREAPAIVQKFLSLAPLQKIGVWSFSIYVWQQPFYLLAHREGIPNWLAFLAAISCGVISFYLVENPARRYLNRIWAKEIPDIKSKRNMPFSSACSQ